ncbi:protein LTV1 homolog [Vigna unguiculata]|nr:protein LTV1 homolog [Vigna unguiculata]
MGGRKKKFIDKKNSATFQLIARDSSDPSFSQSDRVFVRVDNNPVSFPDAEDAGFDDATDDYDDYDGVNGGPLPEDVRKEILELGFPDDGYNYLSHLREIKNTGAGAAFFHNPKFKLQHLPRDIKAYDASKLQISESHGEPEENSLYSVASKTTSVRVQKAVDPEVAALLDDSDVSRLGSDIEDLEEDFVVQANLLEDEDEEKNHICNKTSFSEESLVNRNPNSAHVLQVSTHSRDTDDSGPFHGVTDGVPGVDCVGEKPRARRLLDEQFDLLERQEYGTDNDEDDGDYYENYHADEDESLALKLKHSLKNHGMDDLELDDDKYKVPADLLKNKEAPHEEQDDSAADVIRRCKEYAEGYEVEDENKDVVLVQESSDESEVWDCETIVSTYSNLDNHPAKIEAPGVSRKKKLAQTVSAVLGSSNQIISLRGKEKLPVDFLPGGRKDSTEKSKGQSIPKTEQNKRKQHGLETKEEKKERKAAVKEERREARRTKKETKELYRFEAHRAQRAAAVSGPSSIHLL